MKSSRFFNLISPRRVPFFYGWIILVVGTIGLLMSTPGQTIGVSAFTDSLLSALDISRDQISLAYMGGTMLSAVLLTRAGQFFDRFGPAFTALFASVGLAIALTYLSYINRISAAMNGSDGMKILLILIGFIFIRFFGQGVLTLASRTMVVKWFDARRGLAIGILSVFAAYGFAMAPVLFDYLITSYDWSGAWRVLSIVSGIIFPICVIIFFKDAPETYGLVPDGFSESIISVKQKVRFPVHRDFTLQEAQRTLSLWVFAGYPALFGLVTTGFTFHVVSVFAEYGFSREEAISVFQPVAIVSVIASLSCSLLTDYIRLKYLAFLFGVAALFAMYGVIHLNIVGINYWILIIGYGICAGVHSLLISLFLPRFYGKTHLGAITGQAMTLIVFASALGPILFSQSLSLTGQYSTAAYIVAGGFVILLLLTLIANNPQEKLSELGNTQ